MSVSKPLSVETPQQQAPFFVDFSKASRETVMAIVKAMTKEMQEAMALKRFATFEGAFKRLSPSSSTMM